MAGYERMYPAPHTYALTEYVPEVNRNKPSVTRDTERINLKRFINR